jgi:hypothetical protein
MNFDLNLMVLAFAKYEVYRLSDGRGGESIFYYYDEVTWLIGALAVIAIAWLVMRAYQRARRFRRPARSRDRKMLNRIIKIKRELSSLYLRPGFSSRIHAVGVGVLDQSRQYCIQIFINDEIEETAAGAGAETLPARYRGVPIVPISMRPAAFLSADAGAAAHAGYENGIRERRDVIVGGISGANANLAGQSGTIGYFCTVRSKWRRRKEIHLLSNSHVFADLEKGRVDEHDLILQPSPGEPGSNRAVGTLVDYTSLEFDDLAKENRVDAAIAKLWNAQPHDSVIPFVGGVTGYVKKQDVELGEGVRKFGRTTGYSEGRVASIYLDIWIQYDRTGRAAYFSDQILIEPSLSSFTQFVSKGDSGSLLVDSAQHAVGLIFAGVSDAILDQIDKSPVRLKAEPGVDQPKRIDGYGVANPISDVLDQMNIELVLEGPALLTRGE